MRVCRSPVARSAKIDPEPVVAQLDALRNEVRKCIDLVNRLEELIRNVFAIDVATEVSSSGVEPRTAL